MNDEILFDASPVMSNPILTVCGPDPRAVSPPKDMDIWTILKPLIEKEVERILKEKGLIKEKSEIEFDEFAP